MTLPKLRVRLSGHICGALNEAMAQRAENLLFTYRPDMRCTDERRSEVWTEFLYSVAAYNVYEKDRPVTPESELRHALVVRRFLLDNDVDAYRAACELALPDIDARVAAHNDQ